MSCSNLPGTVFWGCKRNKKTLQKCRIWAHDTCSVSWSQVRHFLFIKKKKENLFQTVASLPILILSGGMVRRAAAVVQGEAVKLVSWIRYSLFVETVWTWGRRCRAQTGGSSGDVLVGDTSAASVTERTVSSTIDQCPGCQFKLSLCDERWSKVQCQTSPTQAGQFI